MDVAGEITEQLAGLEWISKEQGFENVEALLQFARTELDATKEDGR